MGGEALAEVQKRDGDGGERDWEENTERHSQRLLCAKHCSSCVCVCACRLTCERQLSFPDSDEGNSTILTQILGKGLFFSALPPSPLFSLPSVNPGFTTT